MKIAFTICSNNYLAYAKVLANSLQNHEPDLQFFIFLCDERNAEINYNGLANEVIPLSEIESELLFLAAKYNIIELNTCVKPRAFEYLFNERKVEQAFYFDPDIKIYNSITGLLDQLENSSIVLTPHIYTPIPFDHKKPTENHFLNFGIYNLGFIGLKNNEESRRFLSWWKGHTYTRGYIDVYKGIFVDQLPVNLVPIFFRDVTVIKSKACNMAPWNLHERYLTVKEGQYVVNETEPLVFFHFSSFKVDQMELPLSQYDRFTLSARPDLQKIYNEYNKELKDADYFFYKKFSYSYAGIRQVYLKKLKSKKWKDRFLWKNLLRKKKNHFTCIIQILFLLSQFSSIFLKETLHTLSIPYFF